MSTLAIDNSNLVRMGLEGDLIDIFSPAIKMEFSMIEPEGEDPFFGLTVTDETTYVSGDTSKIIHISVHNEETMTEKREQITVTGVPGAKVIDLSDFEGSLRITAFVVTNQHFRADGSFRFSRQDNNLPSIGRSCMVANWSKKQVSEF